MFGKIMYVNDNTAFIENKITEEARSDLLNLHLIFENENQKILGEIVEVKEDTIRVNLLGEFINGRYCNGLLNKASLNSTIRTINQDELYELIGKDEKNHFVLGESATYKGYKVCPEINALFAHHLCEFGSSGSGKSCGVARIIQNILNNNHTLAYNANLIFFDSFGEYKNAFKSINRINEHFNYKYITSKINDDDDLPIAIPLKFLTVDDFSILLQAEKHSQLTIIETAIKYAKIFSINNEVANKYKNHIIANALITILYSSNTTQQKKDDIFTIIDTCHTKEFNFDTPIQGVGFTRSFSECFEIDSRGYFGEETLITEYILKYSTTELGEMPDLTNAVYSLEDFAKALDFTLISEGFNQNKNMHDDAQILKVRIRAILQNNIGPMFTASNETINEFISNFVSKDNKKCQIVNVNLDGIDDAYAKSLVKIITRIIFDFSKSSANRATVPFHLFLEEAHRYIQNDRDVFLLGYNIFERVAKEGRKYGVILNIISQRPVEISETVISQCSNFLIFKMTHPKDIKYIEEMLPNISADVIEKMKVLQPGSCVAFGSAFKIPMIIKLDMPDPAPFSSNCNVSAYWDFNAEVNKEVFTPKEENQESITPETTDAINSNKPKFVTGNVFLEPNEANLNASIENL